MRTHAETTGRGLVPFLSSFHVVFSIALSFGVGHCVPMPHVNLTIPTSFAEGAGRPAFGPGTFVPRFARPIQHKPILAGVPREIGTIRTLNMPATSSAAAEMLTAEVSTYNSLHAYPSNQSYFLENLIQYCRKLL